MARTPPYIPPTYQKTLARLQQGELVRVPFYDIETATYAAGSGSASINRSAHSNGDRTGIGYSLQTGSAGLGSHIASISCIIYGRTVGIRFRKLTTTPSFALVIDGIAYSVSPQNRAAYFDNQQISGLGANKEGIFVVNDLADGPHSVRVILYPDASSTKTLVFYGFLAERVAGYSDSTLLDNLFGGGTLTNANVSVPATDNAGNANHGIKSILYYNTDSVTRVVTITWNSIVIATLSMAAGAPARYDFSAAGVNMGTSPNLVHKADAGSVVNFVCIGSL